jgi:hypothetical protein
MTRIKRVLGLGASRGEPTPRLRLDPTEVIASLATLERRIEERFAGSNLGRLCGDLLELARQAVVRTGWIRRPLWPLRLGVASLMLALLLALFGVLQLLPVTIGGLDLGEMIQGLEAGLSSLVLFGAALFSLTTVERRVKRGRALRALHELRVAAHIVDMYQLTKDPIDTRMPGAVTASSPKRDMTLWELGRYLDYSSEMLALTSKIAALYVDDFDDPVVLASVDGLHTLLDGLTRKIWHKAELVDRLAASLESSASSNRPVATSRPSALEQPAGLDQPAALPRPGPLESAAAYAARLFLLFPDFVGRATGR